MASHASDQAHSGRAAPGAWLAALLMTSAAWLGVGASAAAQSDAEPTPCAAWPGEPAPLPTRSDPDPLRARWAELRAQELLERAAIVQRPAPARARSFRQHAACLDPAAVAAAEDPDTAGPVRVHRPSIAATSLPERDAAERTPEAAAPGEVWSELDRTIALRITLPAPLLPLELPRTDATPVAPPLDPQLDPRTRTLARADALLRRTESRVAQARFDEALELAEQARGEFERLAGAVDVRRRRVRLEVMVATAQVALGNDAAAQASFARAIELDPELELDPQRTSPKVRRALGAARALGPE